MHGLEFANRLTFVDQFTIRVTGKAIPHGESRKHGYPLSSRYEARKKSKSKSKGQADWSKEFEIVGKSKEEIKDLAEATSTNIKSKEKEVIRMKKTLERLEDTQALASNKLRQLRTREKSYASSSLESEAYKNLNTAREA
ncbi:hypothetical protein BGZ76_007171, partial [Entomortierella beljakovae]